MEAGAIAVCLVMPFVLAFAIGMVILAARDAKEIEDWLDE